MLRKGIAAFRGMYVIMLAMLRKGIAAFRGVYIYILDLVRNHSRILTLENRDHIITLIGRRLSTC